MPVLMQQKGEVYHILSNQQSVLVRLRPVWEGIQARRALFIIHIMAKRKEGTIYIVSEAERGRDGEREN